MRFTVVEETVWLLSRDWAPYVPTGSMEGPVSPPAVGRRVCVCVCARMHAGLVLLFSWVVVTLRIFPALSPEVGGGGAPERGL